MIDQISAKIVAIAEEALKEVDQARSLDGLESIRLKTLGKRGSLSEVLKSLGTASPSDRPKIGATANEFKAKIESALETKKAQLDSAALAEQLQKERIDITLPARMPFKGSLHPVTQATRKIVSIFSRLGFDLATGPEVETEYFNFEAANIPKDHPARDMQDTFFMGPGVILRTHTTPVQMRTMKSKKWPIRILCPGAVYRCDDDATHSPMFHQIEGLWVDKNVTMADLKGTLLFFARELFGSGTQIRLRPSYFPFVEPGAEVDVSCFLCQGKKPECRVCKGTGWLEILGAGMVHPRLFEEAGYFAPGKPREEELSGFAFGLGIERIAMLLFEIPDLRLMFQGDQRLFTQL